MGLAKENFYLYSDNPYHIHAYFDRLINTYYEKSEDELLSSLLSKLERITSEKAQSMFCRCRALYLAYVNNDYNAAITAIDEATTQFPRDRKYALSIKFEITRLFRKNPEMEQVIHALEADGANNNAIVICESKLLAVQNRIEEAIEYFNNNISYFTEESKITFIARLRMMH